MDIPVVGYTLPFRHNRGKPPTRYSPEMGERSSRYPIANYVSTERVPESLKTFIHGLSSNHVPSDIHEALTDHKWTQAIKEEMEVDPSPSTQRKEDRGVQMGILHQTQSRRVNRPVQSKASSKGLYTDIRHRLSRDLLASSKIKHCQSTLIYCS